MLLNQLVDNVGNDCKQYFDPLSEWSQHVRSPVSAFSYNGSLPENFECLERQIHLRDFPPVHQVVSVYCNHFPFTEVGAALDIRLHTI